MYFEKIIFFDFFKILNLKLQILEISKKCLLGYCMMGGVGGCPEILMQLVLSDTFSYEIKAYGQGSFKGGFAELRERNLVQCGCDAQGGPC